MSLMFFLLYRIFAVKSISESGNAQYVFFGTKALLVCLLLLVMHNMTRFLRLFWSNFALVRNGCEKNKKQM